MNSRWNLFLACSLTQYNSQLEFPQVHRDTYLEQQETEKIETEVRHVDRILIKCMLAVQGGILGGHKSAPVSHKHMLSLRAFSSPIINEDLPAGPQLVFSLNNRVFRHQACYSLLPARPGGQADRVGGLYKYKVVDQVLTGRCRIPLLTNSTLVQMRGEGTGCGVLANEYSCAHGAQINLGDLTPYLTYAHNQGRTQGGCTGCTCIPPPPPCASPPPGHVHPPPPQPERLVMRKDEAVGNKKKCKFVYLNIIIN